MPLLRTTALIALLLPAAHATLSAQDTTRRRSGVIIGAGLNVVHDPRPADGIPLALEFGYEWAQRSSPLALRLTADYAATRALAGPIGFVYQQNGTPQSGTLTTHTNDVSLGLAGTYTLRTGRFEPYLLSGVAIQRRSLAQDLTTIGGSDTFRGSLYSAGLQAGFGLRAHLGMSTVFMEARTYVPAFGDVNGRRTGTNPLIFGLRF